jgi:GT2 family glycosyltransferase
MVKQPEVSIVIVCMNNLNYLFPCLDSIIGNTHKTSYEILVVAYLFSDNNLKHLREKYPEVIVIESNEIRGFSENNNLALRQAKGDYCFVLNDDTKFDTPIIDQLVESFEKTPDAAIMSPKTLYADGSLQSCGRPKMNIWTFVFGTLKLWNEQKVKSRYTNKNGIFQTCNIVGAAFMIKTAVLKQLNYLDENYFFCPEDIALSTLANKRGFKCYVDADISLYHLEGGTASKIKTATAPAGLKGSLLFYSGNSLVKKVFLQIIITIISVLKLIYWKLKTFTGNTEAGIMEKSTYNSILSLYSAKSPKEIFIHFYNKIR